MYSITSVLVVVVLAGAVVDIFTENRIVRVAAWCITGICFIGFVLFVLLVLPRLLQR
jgi:hypothetical protein